MGLVSRLHTFENSRLMKNYINKEQRFWVLSLRFSIICAGNKCKCWNHTIFCGNLLFLPEQHPFILLLKVLPWFPFGKPYQSTKSIYLFQMQLILSLTLRGVPWTNPGKQYILSSWTQRLVQGWLKPGWPTFFCWNAWERRAFNQVCWPYRTKRWSCWGTHGESQARNESHPGKQSPELASSWKASESSRLAGADDRQMFPLHQPFLLFPFSLGHD